MAFNIKYKVARNYVFQVLSESGELMKCETLLEMLQEKYSKKSPSSTNQLSNSMRMDKRFVNIKQREYNSSKKQTETITYWGIANE